MRHYRMLGALRRLHPALHGGSFRFLSHAVGHFVFEREKNGDRVLVAVNLGMTPFVFPLDGVFVDCISEAVFREQLTLPAGSIAVLVKR